MSANQAVILLPGAGLLLLLLALSDPDAGRRDGVSRRCVAAREGGRLGPVSVRTVREGAASSKRFLDHFPAVVRLRPGSRLESAFEYTTCGTGFRLSQGLGTRIARHASVLGAAYLFARLLDIPFRLVAANLLGEEEFGEFRFAMTLVAFASFLADLGVDQFTTRQIPRMAGAPLSGLPGIVRARLWNTAGMLTALGVAACVLTLMPGYRPGLTGIAILFALVLTAYSFLRAVSRGAERMTYESGAIVLEKLLLVAVGIGLLTVAQRAESLLAAFALSSAAGLGYLAARLIRTFGAAPFRPRSSGPPVWREAWVFGAGGLILMALYRQDIFLLRILGGEQGDRDTGQYGSPFLVLEGLLLPAQMAAFAVLPVISRAWRERQDVAGPVSRILGFFAVLSIPIALGGCLVAGDLMALLFWRLTGSLAVITPVFALLAASFPFVCGNYIAGTVLLAVDRQRYNLACSAFAFLLNLVLNLILIPRHGPVGAAAATLATQAVFLALLLSGCRGCVAWRVPAARLLAFAGALGAMSAAVLLLGGAPVLVRIAAGAGVYAAAALGARLVDAGAARRIFGRDSGSPRAV